MITTPGPVGRPAQSNDEVLGRRSPRPSASFRFLEKAKLEKILRLSNRAEKQGLDLALQSLNKLGLLQLIDDGAVCRGDDNDLIEGRLRCSSKGFCFAIRDDGGDDIYIRDHQLNHAWNGDRVLVRIDARRRPKTVTRRWCSMHPRAQHHKPLGSGRSAGDPSAGVSPR